MTRVPILTSCAELLAAYDALIVDVWGVVHDGRRAYAAAGDALVRFRAAGGAVVLLSNSPMPSSAVIHVLDEKGVRRDVADAIVTSGDVTLAHVRDAGYRRVHHIGPPRDLVLFQGLDVERVGLDDAQAILCTGLIDDVNETGETYRPLLERALGRGLPFVCANPDLIVDVGGVLLPCAGTLAALYETMGGAVYWAGKPYPAAYTAALARLESLTGRRPAPARLLAIGDALRTDIAGAARAGLDALFIAQGIHRDDLVIDGGIDPDRLQRLLAGTAPDVVGAIRGAAIGLAW